MSQQSKRTRVMRVEGKLSDELAIAIADLEASEASFYSGLQRLRAISCAVVAPVTADKRWMRPGELGRKVGLSLQALHRRLRAQTCPPVAARRGPSGRRNWICVTPELLTFLEQPKQPGRLLANQP